MSCYIENYTERILIMFHFFKKANLSLAGVVLAVSFVASEGAWSDECVGQGRQQKPGGGAQLKACKACCKKKPKQPGSPCLKGCDSAFPKGKGKANAKAAKGKK